MNGEHAQRLFDAINRCTLDAGPGVTRPSYSEHETDAMMVVAKEALELGCLIGFDDSCNLHCVLPGSQLTEVVTGSHLDTVPHGGRYDGTAGVVAGLLALRGLKSVGHRHHTARLIVFRGEESAWFGKCYLGSLGLFCKLTDADVQLRSKHDSETLANHRGAGRILGPSAQYDTGNFRAFVEVHIEQGPVLHAAREPIGIVTTIRGNRRYPNCRIVGTAAHSGTTPMTQRADAIMAFAQLMDRMETYSLNFPIGTPGSVFTCGSVHTPHGSMTTVPDLVECMLEFRADTWQDLEMLDQSLAIIASDIAQQRRVSINLGSSSESAPVTLDKNIRSLLGYHGGLVSGTRVPELPSGAGHDAAVFQQAGIPTGMIFIRNEHGSHNPRESMLTGDFLLATEVLTRTMADTAL